MQSIVNMALGNEVPPQLSKSFAGSVNVYDTRFVDKQYLKQQTQLKSQLQKQQLRELQLQQQKQNNIIQQVLKQQQLQNKSLQIKSLNTSFCSNTSNSSFVYKAVPRSAAGSFSKEQIKNNSPNSSQEKTKSKNIKTK
ncbi:Hypothetical_protein [Hexamita inflata]|uniref:Hypothetical_protein n=1 Tax=Hexamita inflata TaxID=28002 RepID=A0AA86RBN3_9EUKA|nr:Hypothetical protein HINF_LOCUS29762 [Hexamita inflata]CAI9974460.1 Hypothetical protein HINF_LOCUS62105 [Hexamita inflata]